MSGENAEVEYLKLLQCTNKGIPETSRIVSSFLIHVNFQVGREQLEVNLEQFKLDPKKDEKCSSLRLSYISTATFSTSLKKPSEKDFL